ncbi:hypothetical protein [Streptomyces hydrogenans]|uniref:hypothetical protein n=1 Tax=Streptomyces hydrogenans TaxID=1873719 RepID=UPI003D70A77B
MSAIMEGDRALRSAPWFPSRPGDLLTVTYEAWGAEPEWSETYVVVPSAAGRILELQSHTRGETRGLVGAFAVNQGYPDDDPFTTPWMEAGPDRLTVTRDGVTVHGARR